ncbi:MAG TPA: cupredoxin domain-containing protein [Anaerolineales bacterium]|nr:cupredoxin domain-containing protein [Anaerolineales bacterium]
MLLKKVLSVILLSMLLAACGVSSPATEITVTMTEFGFEPNTINVTAGEPVKLTLVNNGAVEHDFAVEVIPVENVSTEGMDMDHMSGDHAEFDLHTATGPGETSVLKFTPTAPGTYKIICSVPGHLEAGMTGELIVK